MLKETKLNQKSSEVTKSQLPIATRQQLVGGGVENCSESGKLIPFYS